MPLTPNVWGPAIAQALYAWAQGNLPQDSFVTTAQLEDAWTVITTEDKDHINDNADIELQIGDIDVDPGTLITVGSNDPIEGVGLNQAVTLTQKIK